MAIVTTELVSLLVILKPNGQIKRMVFLLLKLGQLQITLMARLNWKITLLVKYIICCKLDLYYLLSYMKKEGLKIELITSLLPSVNEKGAKVNATYKQPNIHTIATFDVFKVNTLISR